jgi:hypothetical protein
LLLHHYKEQRWLVSVQDSRKLEVTPLGKEMFVKAIGVEATLFEVSAAPAGRGSARRDCAPVP